MAKKTALIVGATGLVGQELIDLMLSGDLYNKIIVLTRRSIGKASARLHEVLVEDFDKMDDFAHHFDVEDVYCCLGTTRKQAGSKEMFKKIDLEYPVRMAELALKHKKFHTYFVVTAVGANPESPLFYNEVKGHLEKALIELKIPSLQIFRPSLLLGHRKDFRLGEEVAKKFSGLLSFFIVGNKRGQLWSIKGYDVAKAMLKIASLETSGVNIYSPRQMIELAHQ